MPQIPFESQRITASPVAIQGPDASQAGLEWGAVAVAGKRMTELGGALAEIQEKERQADRVMQFQKARHALEMDTETAKAGFSERQDHQNFETEYWGAVPQMMEKYREIVTDPEVWARFEPYAQMEIEKTGLVIRRDARVKRNVEYEAFNDSLYKKDLAAYAVEPDDARRQEIKSSMIMSIMAAREAGIYRADKAQKLLDGIDANAEEYRAEAEIEAGRPEGVYRDLMDPKKYTNLTSDRRVELRTKARRRSIELYQEKERIEREAQEDTLEKAFDMMRDPKIPMRDKVNQVLAWREKDAATGIRLMSPATAERFLSDLQTGGAGGKGKTDAVAWANIFERMYADDPKDRPTAAELLALRQTGKLSEGDYESFMKLGVSIKVQEKKALKEKDKEFYQEAKDRVKDYKKIVEATIGTKNATQKELAQRVMTRIQQQANLLKPGDDLDRINKYADYMIEWTKESWFKGKTLATLKAQMEGEALKGTVPGKAKSSPPAAPAMTEKDARAKLTAQGITGKDADTWIEKYRAAGKVE